MIYDAELNVWFLTEFDEVRIDSVYARVKKNGKDYDSDTIKFNSEEIYYDDEYSGKAYPVQVMLDRNKISHDDYRYQKMYIKIDDCQYDTVAEEVEFIGYPINNGHNRKVYSFSLKWYASKMLTLKDDDLVHALARIGKYNAFCPSNFLNALMDSDFEINVLLGRESSVAIYIYCEHGEEFIKNLKQNEVLPDEYDHGWIYREEIQYIVKRDLGKDVNFNNVWRLWWD